MRLEYQSLKGDSEAGAASWRPHHSEEFYYLLFFQGAIGSIGGF